MRFKEIKKSLFIDNFLKSIGFCTQKSIYREIIVKSQRIFDILEMFNRHTVDRAALLFPETVQSRQRIKGYTLLTVDIVIIIIGI